jgi:uncharacterized damage-inducible protein DinB
MSVKDLQQLFDYSYWANEHLFSVLDQLEPGQFTQSVAGSYESIRSTLVHVLSAEWGWLDRCGGPERGERLKAEDYPTLESLVVAWKRVEGYMRTFLSGLNDDDLAREIEFALGAGPRQTMLLGDLMQHAAVHAVHHRGQVALLLRMLGHAPGNFDFVLYASSSRSQHAH